MDLIERFLGSFRPVEPVWCCERCRGAALAAAADRRGANQARAKAREALAARTSRPPLSRISTP